MGFDGKTLIHPSQVEPANDVWAPIGTTTSTTPERVIDAFDEAVADGRGVVTVDGRMIENLHVANARRVLAIADAIAALRYRCLFGPGPKRRSVRSVGDGGDDLVEGGVGVGAASRRRCGPGSGAA